MLKSFVLVFGATALMAGTALAAADPATFPDRGQAHALYRGTAGLLVAETAPSIASPFLWSASKAADGTVSFAGHVPSQDVQQTLLDGIAKVGADTSSVAEGAPDDFAANAVAALVVLADLDSGKVSFDGSGWSVTGAVDSSEKASAAQAAFDISPLKTAGALYTVTAPATAAAADAKPVALAPVSYVWSAEKAADGSVTLAGDVPTAMLKAFLAGHVGSKVNDGTIVAPGAPKSFPGGTLYGLNALMGLDSGKLALQDGKWSLTGSAKSDDASKSALAALSSIDTKDWAIDVKVSAQSAAAPAAVAAPAAPAAPVANSPWSAEKSADGTITFAGAVPTAVLKSFLAGHVDGGKVVDNTTVTAGDAKSFAGPALYGLNALMALDSGKLVLADGKWSLSGTASTDAAASAATGALSSIDTKAWAVDIKTAPAVASAAPATAAPAATATAAPVASDYAFSATKAPGGAIVLTGDVPTEGALGYLADMAGNAPRDGLKVLPGAPADFITNVLGGLDALSQLDAGQFALADGKWSLKGSAATPALHDSVVASLGKLPAGKDFAADDITGPAPIKLCGDQLAAFKTGGGAINFDGRTTKFSKGVEAQLDTVAKALALCPAVRVDVAGNTDSDGPAEANMALSVARAEAVVGALIKRGIDAQRLYAVGYGETLPLVPNTTKANKAKNRRIDFKLVDGK